MIGKLSIALLHAVIKDSIVWGSSGPLSQDQPFGRNQAPPRRLRRSRSGPRQLVVHLGSGVCERSGLLDCSTFKATGGAETLLVIVLVLHWRQHVHKESVGNTGGPKAWPGMINRTSYRKFELLPGGKGATVGVWEMYQGTIHG